MYIVVSLTCTNKKINIMPHKYEGVSKDIFEKYNEVCDIACNEVERMARGILKDHPELDEFIMAMGSYSFTYKDKRRSNDLEPRTQKMDSSWNFYYVDSEPFMRRLNSFIGEWDSVLKITGEPMRFTADGDKITDW